VVLVFPLEHCNADAGGSDKLCPRQHTFAYSLPVYRPLQIVAQTFSGLAALLAASTFAEAKNKGLPQ
jgi:hypothetical protein